MTAGALLNYYTTPAERLRGCVFAEGFESVNRVNQNNGRAVGISPTISNKVATFSGVNCFSYSKISLERAFSVSFWFRTSQITNPGFMIANQIGTTAGWSIYTNATGIGGQVYDNTNTSMGTFVVNIGAGPTWYSDNNWHHVVWSFSKLTSLQYVIVDGVALLSAAALNAVVYGGSCADYLAIGSHASGSFGHVGSIKDVKIFNQALTTQEAQQLYAGNVYSYRRRMACYLPMGIAQHDAVNGRTLDVSGNNRHATFAAGAATPTKISGQRGYSFDGGDYMSLGDFGVANTGAWTFCATVGKYSNQLITGQLASEDNSSAALFVWDAAGAGMGINQQPGLVVDPVLPGSSTQFWAWSKPTGNPALFKLYRQETLKVTGLVAGRALSLVYLGADGLLSTAPFRLVGNIYSAAWWFEELSNLQIADWYALQLQQLNRV